MPHANPEASKWSLSMRARGGGGLRATVIGAQWTQQRLYSIGHADDRNCIFCPDCCGHLHHRQRSCPNLVGMIAEAVDADSRRRALQAPPNDLFYARSPAALGAPCAAATGGRA
eukprot:6826137-Pyramimonas_sp.AAC.1